MKEEGVKWDIWGRYSEIESAVMEYSLAKICAALDIGVKVGSPDYPFDLISYLDCVEFAMEKCRPIYAKREIWEIEERLKYCLAVMHTFGIVHKDVKPDNVLITE